MRSHAPTQISVHVYGNPNDPSIQIMPTSCPKVCQSYLHLAIGIGSVYIYIYTYIYIRLYIYICIYIYMYGALKDPPFLGGKLRNLGFQSKLEPSVRGFYTKPGNLDVCLHEL